MTLPFVHATTKVHQNDVVYYEFVIMDDDSSSKNIL
jgi:hypothetical protein